MKRLLLHANLAFALVVSALAVSALPAPSARAAACAAPSTDYGTVTNTVTVPTTGVYSIWSRMAAPNSGSNSYMLEVSNNGTTNCYTVAGKSTGLYTSGATTHFQSGDQNWTKTTTGSPGSPITMSLNSGSTTTIKMIGTAADVYLDRVVLTTDASCQPTGNGDNCASPPDDTPAVVNITSPTDGSSPSSPITVAVSATDNDGIVSKVELWVDDPTSSGAADYSDLVSPYSFTNITLTPGSHTLLAKVTNGGNLVTTSSLVTITIPSPPDTTQPSAAAITSPAAGSAQSGTITVTGTGTDNVGVSRIEFLVDGNEFAEDSSSPYSVTLDTTTLSNASHNLTARVFDAAGNSRTSSAVAITINNNTGGTDTTPPTVSVPTAFSNNTIVAGKTQQFSVDLADTTGIQQVEFQIDGVTRATRTTAPLNSFSFDTTTLSTGNHTVRARATDSSTAHNVSAWTSFTIRISALQDINRDCRITVNSDVSPLITRLNQNVTTNGLYDMNGDGRVTANGDLSTVILRLNQTPCTP